MIPVEWFILGVIFAFASGWALRADHDEKKRPATRINPMFGRDWK